MRIDIRNLADTDRAIGEYARQIPYATSRAINTTAFGVRGALQGELTAKLDRPTPWLVRSVWVQTSSKTSLTAIVGSKESVEGKSGKFERVLTPHIAGGARLPKPVEDQIRRKGWIRDDWRAVPTDAEVRDQYGNVAISDWQRLLSLNSGSPDHRYFVVKVGDSSARVRHLKPGIYRRYGNNKRLEQLVVFVPDTDYRPRVDWSGVAGQTVSSTFPEAFNKSLTDAINSAR